MSLGFLLRQDLKQFQLRVTTQRIDIIDLLKIIDCDKSKLTRSRLRKVIETGIIVWLR